ncbi:RHS repeat-associated core domain-containing protein [Paenibacillus wenxiniae]|uniref:RHS repeat-associated core domain-containing protein n=1 Tax=Paenibacillus wenxiniae TaxID=1636843 RepID=A0ABW4RKM9_9BACL
MKQFPVKEWCTAVMRTRYLKWLGLVLFVSLGIMAPHVQAAQANTITIPAGWEYSYTHSYSSGIDVYVQGQQFEYAVYNPKGHAEEYGTYSGRRAILIPAGFSMEIANTSSSDLTINSGSRQLQQGGGFYPGHALVSMTLQPGDSVDALNLSSTASNTIHIGGISAYLKTNGSGTEKIFNHHSSASVQTVDQGGDILITNRDTQPYLVYAAGDSFSLTSTSQPADFNYTLPVQGSLQMTNTSNKTNYVYVTAKGQYEYFIYNADDSTYSSGLTTSPDKAVQAGQRLVITNTTSAPITLNGPYYAFATSTQIDPPMTTYTLAPGKNLKVQNTSNGTDKLFLNGVYEHAEYDASGNVANYNNGSTLSTYMLPSGNTVVFTNPSSSQSITIRVPREETSVSNSDDPALYYNNLAPGGSLEATNLTGGYASIQTNSRYDYAFYDSLGIMNYQAYAAINQLQVQAGQRVAFTNVGVTVDRIYTPYEAFRFSVHTQPITFTQTLQPGQTIKAVNTSRYPFHVSADGQHHYAIYGQKDNSVSDYGFPVKGASYLVTNNQLIVITNSYTTPLTISGPNDAFTWSNRTAPALYKGYLNSGDSIKVTNSSPNTFQLSVQGTYDQSTYQSDQSLQSLNHNSTAGLLPLYVGDRTVITNSGNAQLVLLAPYDVTGLQSSAEPALLMKQLALNQSAEFTNVSNAAATVYFTGKHDLMDYDAKGNPNTYIRQSVSGDHELSAAQKLAVMNRDNGPIDVYGAYELFKAMNREHPVTFHEVLTNTNSLNLTNTAGKLFNLYTSGGAYDYVLRDSNGKISSMQLMDTDPIQSIDAGNKLAVTGSTTTPAVLEGPYDAFNIETRTNPALIKRTLQPDEYVDAVNVDSGPSLLGVQGHYSLANYKADGSLSKYVNEMAPGNTALASGMRVGVQNVDTTATIVYGPYESFVFKDRQHPVTFKTVLSSNETIAYVQNALPNLTLYTTGTYDYAQYKRNGAPESYGVQQTETGGYIWQGDRIVISGSPNEQVTVSGSYDGFQATPVQERPVLTKVLQTGENYSLRNISPGGFSLKLSGTHAYQLYDASGKMTYSLDHSTSGLHILQPGVRIAITSEDANSVTVWAPTEAVRVTQGDDLASKTLAQGQSMRANNTSAQASSLLIDGTYDVAIYDASGQPTDEYGYKSTDEANGAVSIPVGGYAIVTAESSAGIIVRADKTSITFADANHAALSLYTLSKGNMLKVVNVTDHNHTLSVNGSFNYWTTQTAEQPGNGTALIGSGDTAIIRNTSAGAETVYSPYGLFQWAETTDPVITPPATGTPISSLNPASGDPQTFYADPIDTSTGAQMINKNVLTAHGSIDIPFQAQYYSLLQGNGALGKGWSDNYAIRLQKNATDGSVNVYWNDFRFNTFTRQSDGSYTSNQKEVRYDGLIVNADGSYTLSRYNRTALHFAADGTLQSMSNSDGITVNMQYDDSGKLTAVIEPSTGAKLVLTYTTTGHVATVADQSGRKASFTYDDNGQLTDITDPTGMGTTYTYDANHRITTGALAGKQLFANTYDDTGRVTEQTDGIPGHTTKLAYSTANGQMTTTITDRNGNVQQRVHDAQYQLVQVQDALAGKTTYTYDEQGNRTSITNALNQTTHFTYDDKGNVLKATDPSGQSITMTYDSLGDLLTATGPDGSTITSTYDNRGRLLTTTDTEGHQISYAYNEQGQLTSVTDPRGGQTLYGYADQHLSQITEPTGETVAIGYDAAGRMTSETNAAGNTARIVYNDSDQLVATLDELKNKTSYTYDDQNHLASITDPKGNVTHYNYDANGELTGITDALGNKTSIAYDAEGQMTGVNDALGRTTTFTYDADGHLLSETNAKGESLRYTYDALGRPIAAYDGLNHQSYTVQYDTAGNPIKLTDALGNTYTSTYNELNQLTETADPLGHKTSYSYDKRNQLTDVTDALQGHTSQTLDAFGDITAMTDANGNEAQYKYDLLGRLTREQDAAGGSHTYVYNNVGLVSKETDKDGRDTTYAYDATGHLVHFTDNAGEVSYGQDANHNIVSVTGSDGKVIRRTFDALNRVVSYTDGDGHTIGYTYDAAGQLTTLTYPDGKKVHYTYDGAGRMSTVTDWAGHQTSYTYDAAGQLVTTKYADGTQENRAYDAAGQLTSLTVLNPDGSTLAQTTYSYDAAGNVTNEDGGEIDSPAGSVTGDVYGPGLSPDPGSDAGNNGGGNATAVTNTNQVQMQSGAASGSSTQSANEPMPAPATDTAVQADVYSGSDAAGSNPGAGSAGITHPTVTQDTYGLLGDLTMTYTADNRLATVNGQAVQYDAEGNMLYGPLQGSMQDYSYDARNRLIAAGDVSYGYDNENNRTSITVNGVTTKQIINPQAVLSQVLMETDGSGNPTAWYVYGLGLISRYDASGNMQTYHYDLRGSTIALTDDKGNVTDTYTYDTYGEELSHDGTTNQPFQYDGRDGVQTDPNGLYQMRSRYYNPEIRRFVNRDVVTGTIADGLTMNRYAYVNGNPVSYVDPFGLSAERSDLMRTGFSMALDAIPFVGTVKGIQEVLTGTDLITGQQLSVADRVAEGAGTLLSFLPDGKLLGTFAAKEAIDGGEWAWRELSKEERYAKPSELFREGTYAPAGQRIAPKNLYRELNKSQVGKETINLIESNNTKIRLDYGEVPTDASGNQILGKANMNTNTATVFVRETESIVRTAQTIIHEVTHTSLNNPIYTQREEIIAFMREAQHIKNNLSYGEIRAIIEEVKSLYPNIPYR